MLAGRREGRLTDPVIRTSVRIMERRAVYADLAKGLLSEDSERQLLQTIVQKLGGDVRWSSANAGEAFTRQAAGATTKAVLRALGQGPLREEQIVAATRIRRTAVHGAVNRLVRGGQVRRLGGGLLELATEKAPQRRSTAKAPAASGRGTTPRSR